MPPPRATDALLEPIRRALASFNAHVPIPALELITGMIYVQRHSQIGHPSFLLGDYRDRGWWYYFPVVFFFKTPLPYSALAMAGIVLLVRRGTRRRDGEWIAVAIAPVAMFLPAMASGINIGLRHILPVYPLLTVAAAYAVCELWSSANRVARPVVVMLLAWYFIATAIAHPDYLAYFNELAGRQPDRIAVDSNLDWGQDLLRLSDVTHREHIGRLHLAYFGSAVWTDQATTVESLEPGACTNGWVAVSETILKQGGLDHRGLGFRWLEPYPSREIGRSIRLYHVPNGVCEREPSPRL
jgi:hypothetical protein